ncbi:fibroblast growth factor 4A [Solea solea]|uniref:fibroblast growth factor 4A n=1 Tax=Solea solea TaxID=90069 RepID=UPI00272DC215|nr:fibroblast growth factor 4A [Solea solea]
MYAGVRNRDIWSEESRDTSACRLEEPAIDPPTFGLKVNLVYPLTTATPSKSGSHPIGERVKQQLLYCRVGIGYHLQILPNGSVGGVHNPTEFSWLKVFAMKHGVVGIKGVKSGLFLCMSKEGQAYGTEQFSSDCLLKENLEENHYTTYSSLSHPGNYLALSHKGELRKGSSVGRHQPCTHFLPRRAS